MKDVMLDLESLGLAPGCSIVSIGAVAFDPITGELGDEFYTVVDRSSCRRVGLYEDPKTRVWWGCQKETVRRVLYEAGNGVPIAIALNRFTEYLGRFGIDEVRVWGNGASFDNALLASCYAAIGSRVPWNHLNDRCYRTLKNLVRGLEFKHIGTPHNALDDAKSQAMHAIQLLKGVNTDVV